MSSEAEHALMAEDCAPDTQLTSIPTPVLRHSSSTGPPGTGDHTTSGLAHSLPRLSLKEQLPRVRFLQQYLTGFELQVRIF